MPRGGRGRRGREGSGTPRKHWGLVPALLWEVSACAWPVWFGGLPLCCGPCLERMPPSCCSPDRNCVHRGWLMLAGTPCAKEKGFSVAQGVPVSISHPLGTQFLSGLQQLGGILSATRRPPHAQATAAAAAAVTAMQPGGTQDAHHHTVMLCISSRLLWAVSGDVEHKVMKGV